MAEETAEAVRVEAVRVAGSVEVVRVVVATVAEERFAAKEEAVMEGAEKAVAVMVGVEMVVGLA